MAGAANCIIIYGFFSASNTPWDLHEVGVNLYGGDFTFALKGIRTFVDACGCKFMIRFTILGELEMYFRLGT